MKKNNEVMSKDVIVYVQFKKLNAMLLIIKRYLLKAMDHEH